MRYQYMSDSHTHTNCSPDGSNSVDEMYRRAKELELYYYTITDHCECNDYDGAHIGFSYRKWTDEGYRRMSESAERLHYDVRLLKGLELGQPVQNFSAAEDVLGARAYDFVLGSVHNIKGFEDFYFLKYDEMPEGYIDRLLTSYFGEMLQMVQWGKIDSVAHLTYPLRYIRGDHKIEIDMRPHEEEVRAVFTEMIRRDIALEINTSGLRQAIGCFLPDKPYVELYRSMGGRLLTIGSDAHRVEDLGKGIEEGLEMMKEAGFTEFAVYVAHEPQMLPIK